MGGLANHFTAYVNVISLLSWEPFSKSFSLLFLKLFKFVFYFLVPSGCALKCYHCVGTEDTCSKSRLESNKAIYLKECPSIADRCARSWSRRGDVNAVGNDCANEAACDAAKEFCDKLKDSIKDYKCGVGCCTGDGCNAGSPVTFSFFLLIVSSVLGLALMK